MKGRARVIEFFESLSATLVELRGVILQMYGRDQGREVLGGVAGRPAEEDMTIGIDRIAEREIFEALQMISSQKGLAFRVFSEHENAFLSPENGQAIAHTYVVCVDPFDGSGLFQKGFPRDWWVVLSVLEENGTPVGGMACDIWANELYVAQNKRVVLTDLTTLREQVLHPAGQTSLEGSVQLAAYVMNPRYGLPFFDRLRPILEGNPRIRVWPNGGSCIYPWLARGLVHAYIMFEEPRTEIDPGLGFARAAGLHLFSVGADGVLADYVFDASNTTGRVPFFIASCTRELAEEIAAAVNKSSP